MKLFPLIIGLLLCEAAAFGQAPELVWAKQSEGIGINYGYSVTTDNSGNVYTTGFFTDTIDFDTGPGVATLISNGGTDIFVLKLNSTGDFLWVRQIGGLNYDGMELSPDPMFGAFSLDGSVNVDSLGNVYTMGNFSGTVDFDPGPDTFNLTSIGNYDYFIQKLDSIGDFVWAIQTDAYGNKSSMDKFGNIYTTGFFTGNKDFDPSPMNSFVLNTHGNEDFFIQKIDANGAFSWAKSFGDIGMDRANGIAVDENYVYTTGVFSTSTVDFDPGPDTVYLAGPRMFVLKLDLDGNYIWAQNMGGHYSGETPRDIAVDNLGNTYTIGHFNTSVFIQKLNSDGNYLWGKYIDGGIVYDTPEYQRVFIAVDSQSDIYATGHFTGTVDFDPSAGVYDISTELPPAWISTFVLNLDSNGNFEWAGKIEAGAFGLHCDKLDNVYITGTFGPDTIDFAPSLTDTFNIIGGGVFIVKLAADDLITSSNETGMDGKALISPNPTTSQFTLDFQSMYKNVELTISSIDGRIIQRGHSQNIQSLDLTINEAPGLYFVNIIADGERQTFKVVKQ